MWEIQRKVDNKRTKEQADKITNKRTNEQTNKRTYKRTNKQTKGGTKERWNAFPTLVLSFIANELKTIEISSLHNRLAEGSRNEMKGENFCAAILYY